MTPPVTWHPSRTVFVRRALINGALTLLIAAVLLLVLSRFIQMPVSIALFLAVIAAFAGLFEDLMRWRRVRAETWQLDLPHLVHDGPEGIAMIPLGDITKASTRWGGTVILQLRSGQRVALRYLDNPAGVMDAVNRTRPA